MAENELTDFDLYHRKVNCLRLELPQAVADDVLSELHILIDMAKCASAIREDHARLTEENEHWREVATEDREKWSFDALVWMANRMLTEIYPASVFTGESGEKGPGFVAGMRKALAALKPQSEGGGV
jgi:hypothetical protein